jgi:Raf kinase inhibitor-like YbhB/YbcL family protein
VKRCLGLAVAALAVTLGGCGGAGKSSAGVSSSTTSVSTGASAATATDLAKSRSTGSTPAAPGPTATLARGFHLTSPAFRPNGAIPRQYTCDGRDISLPLRFSGVPPQAQELVLLMRDPDAASGNFVHWALAGISPSTTRLDAGGVPGQIVPGRNSFGSLGYRGPCPPHTGKSHHYVITLNALGGRSGLKPGFTADELQTAAVGIATLVGTYRRH